MVNFMVNHFVTYFTHCRIVKVDFNTVYINKLKFNSNLYISIFYGFRILHWELP